MGGPPEELCDSAGSKSSQQRFGEELVLRQELVLGQGLDGAKIEEDNMLFDPVVEKQRLEFLYGDSVARNSRRRAPRKKKVYADPPGSTLSTETSLADLRTCFGISDEVEFKLPSPADRAENPPSGYFTVYESYFSQSFLWFPIPELIWRFLRKHRLALSQITTRGLRHLVGILVRSYECDVEIGVFHLMNLLEFRRFKRTNVYYISNKKNWKIFSDFPNKDLDWNNHFFYVLINEASVPPDCFCLVKSNWAPIVRYVFPRFPEHLLEVYDLLRASKTRWLRDFSLRRVEKARALAEGYFLSSDSHGASSSSGSDADLSMMKSAFRARRTSAGSSQLATLSKVGETSADARKNSDTVGSPVLALTNAKDVEKRVTSSASKDKGPSSDLHSRSTVIALASSKRPRDSSLSKHGNKEAPSRKRSNKGDTIQRVDDKKKRAVDPTVSKSVDPDSFDVAGSSSLFMQCRSSRKELPSLDAMTHPKTYGAVSLRGTKLVESINELTAEFEATVRADRRRVEDARRDVSLLEERLALVESKHNDELAKMVERLRRKHEKELDKVEKDNANLRDDIVKLKSRHELDIQNARGSLERELSSEF